MGFWLNLVTIGLIEHKLEEHKLLRSTKLKVVNPGQTINLGSMKVEFIRTTHSIPDACSLAIHTPVGTVVHTGDFKIDYTPIDGEMLDFGRLAALGNKGVLALMSDSTNSERKGYTMSESIVGDIFDKLFLNCTKRIVVATFSSNVHRLQQVLDISKRYNRKIAFTGRSMVNVSEVALKLGELKFNRENIVDIEKVDKMDDKEVLIMTTGSQGEPMSALTRIASSTHRHIQIEKDDMTGTITLTLNDTVGTSVTLPIYNKQVIWNVSGLAAGKYTVTMEYVGDTYYCNDIVQFEVEVLKATPTVELNNNNFYYNGSSQSIEVNDINTNSDGNINIAEINDGSITPEHADYLRKKFLWGVKGI